MGNNLKNKSNYIQNSKMSWSVLLPYGPIQLLLKLRSFSNYFTQKEEHPISLG